MRSLLPLLAAFSLAYAADAPAPLPPTKADVPYAGTSDFRQTLNVYAPAAARQARTGDLFGFTVAAGVAARRPPCS